MMVNRDAGLASSLGLWHVFPFISRLWSYNFDGCAVLVDDCAVLVFVMSHDFIGFFDGLMGCHD